MDMEVGSLDLKSKKMIQEFSELDLGIMKKKLKEIIKIMDTSKLPNLEEIGDIIDVAPEVTVEFCISVYQQIIILIYGLTEIQKKQAQKKLGILHDKIEKLHKLEEIERIKENPDKLLDLL